MFNDFHVHSNESDGQLSPEMLIDMAIGKGISVIALCDHDTTSGGKRFKQYGESRGVKALSGIELSAQWKGGNCHLLGISVNNEYEPLETVLKKTRESRKRRNELILEKLSDLGADVNPEQLRIEAGGEVIARPHIAMALLKAGYVNSFQEAFDKYLCKNGLAYVDRFRLPPVESVKLLNEAGAFTVLAHPAQLNLSSGELFDFVILLKNAGLKGVEVYAPNTSDQQISFYKEMADSLGLAVTGGSDFHGSAQGGREIGYYQPNRLIPQINIPELGI